MNAHAKISCPGGGISSLKWVGPSKIFAACQDHTIKLVNADKYQVEEVLFTQHKVATCLDAFNEDLLLTGHEDALIKLWDVRTGIAERTFKSQYDAHSKWVSQVKFNNNVEHVFLSGSYDGSLKLWDTRNEERPLTTLKRKGGKESDNDYKVFAVEWNGPSQILSGGSDSHIAVHQVGA